MLLISSLVLNDVALQASWDWNEHATDNTLIADGDDSEDKLCY
jgi:hypothetical protein